MNTFVLIILAICCFYIIKSIIVKTLIFLQQLISVLKDYKQMRDNISLVLTIIYLKKANGIIITNSKEVPKELDMLEIEVLQAFIEKRNKEGADLTWNWLSKNQKETLNNYIIEILSLNENQLSLCKKIVKDSKLKYCYI